MKEELIELIELLVDIAIPSNEKTEMEPICLSQQSTQDTQQKNSDRHLSKTRYVGVVQQPPKRALK